jgi:hypothetical protein
MYLFYRLVRGEGPETKTIKLGGGDVQITPGIPKQIDDKIGALILQSMAPRKGNEPRILQCDGRGCDTNGRPIEHMPEEPYVEEKPRYVNGKEPPKMHVWEHTKANTNSLEPAPETEPELELELTHESEDH